MPSKKTSFLHQYLKTEYLLILIIFTTFVFTRFYNLDKRIIFGWDQEQFSTQIRDIIVNRNFTLLGPRVNNDLGFFLAPYLTYFLVPFYLLTNLHPFALFYWSIVINILFFTVSFIAVKKLFSTTHALWFLAFWTFNFQAHIYDMIPWWPQLIPLGVMITILLLKYLFDDSEKWYLWVTLGLVQGIFSNMHFQFVFIFFFTTIISFFILNKKKKFWNYFLLYMCSFLLTFAPLFIFDLRNNFLNLTLFLNFFITGTDNTPRDLLSWIPVFGNFIQPFTFTRNSYIAASFFLIIATILFYLMKISKNIYASWYKSLFAVWIIIGVCFSLYGKRPSEYYFMFILPIIFLTLIDFFYKLKKPIILYIFFVIFLLINIMPVKKNMQPNYGGLYYKEAVVKYIKNVFDAKEFNISYNGVSVDHGFKYLLDYYGVQQSGNSSDPLIEVSIPARKNSTLFGLYGVSSNF